MKDLLDADARTASAFALSKAAPAQGGSSGADVFGLSRVAPAAVDART